MSELQIALVLLGGLAIIGIVVYNRLQERKFRQLTEAGFAPPGRDVLLEDRPARTAPARVEPDFSEPLIGEAEPAGLSGRDGQEPHFGDADVALDAALGGLADGPASVGVEAAAPSTAAPAGAGPVEAIAFDEAIEFRTVLKKLEGMAAAGFAEPMSASAGLGKPVRWLGLPLGSPAWEEVSPGSGKSYLEVQAIMPLVDRGGAARKEALAGLCSLTQELADTHGWQMRCEDPAEAAARAASLDKFCADMDVQIGLNIVARGAAALPLGRIREQAESAGMELGGDGAYQFLDSRGKTLYLLGNREPRAFSRDSLELPETRGVTLLFDVPRVPDGLKNFDRMVALGRQLAEAAGGLVVDDNLRPLSDAGIEKIRAQLAQIYDRMEAHGVPAGSRVALKLFS